MNHLLVTRLLPAAVLSLSFSTLAVGQCTIAAPGVQDPSPPADGWSVATPLGFAFPFNGTTYTDFFYSDHGVIALTNGGVPVEPPNNSQLYDVGSQPDTGLAGGGGFAGFGADVIMAYWGDHLVGSASPDAGIYVDNSSGSHMTITWLDNEPFDGFAPGAFTAQMTLFANGEVVVCLDGRCNNTSSEDSSVTTVIGISVNGNPIPAESDFSAGPVATADPTVFEEFTGVGPAGTNTPDPLFDLADTTIRFLPTNPGWVVTVEPLLCATSTTVGTGCSGLSLASTSVPRLGTSWDLELSGIAAPAPLPNFIAFGAETTPTPIGLLFSNLFGTSCESYMDASLGLVDIGAADATGVASLAVALPLDASLKGAALTGQGLSFDPTSAALFALSNGQSAVLGY